MLKDNSKSVNTSGYKLPIDYLQWVHHPQVSILQMEVLILRLDLIHPLISGNKWLKLEGWKTEFDKRNFNGIITSGGPWSNHLHATGAFCAHHGIPFTAIVNARDGFRTATIRDLDDWGHQVIYEPSKDFDHEKTWKPLATKQNALFIPVGGEGEPGRRGVVEFFKQLIPKTFDVLYCSIGTGTTLEGIMESGLNAKEWLAYNPGFNDPDLYASLTQKAGEYSSKTISFSKPEGEKFGRHRMQLIYFMRNFWKQTGIPTDIVYTGKMMRYFLENMSLHAEAGQRKILLVHTGGLQGNRSLPAKTFEFMQGSGF